MFSSEFLPLKKRGRGKERTFIMFLYRFFCPTQSTTHVKSIQWQTCVCVCVCGLCVRVDGCNSRVAFDSLAERARENPVAVWFQRRYILTTKKYICNSTALKFFNRCFLFFFLRLPFIATFACVCAFWDQKGVRGKLYHFFLIARFSPFFFF